MASAEQLCSKGSKAAQLRSRPRPYEDDRRFGKLADALGGVEPGDVLRLTRRTEDRREVWLRSVRCGDGSGAACAYVPKVHRHVYPRGYDRDRLPRPIQVTSTHNLRCCVRDMQMFRRTEHKLHSAVIASPNDAVSLLEHNM